MSKLKFLLTALFLMTFGIATYAQTLVANRNIDLGGELCQKCNIFLLIDGKVEGTNNPKFIVRLAVGNNIYDYTLNDEKQTTYIFSNDVEADKHRKRIKHLVTNAEKSHLLSVDEEGIKVWSYINTKLQQSFPEKLNIFTFATNQYKVAYSALKPNGNIENKIYDYVNKKASNFKAVGGVNSGLYSDLRMSANGQYLLGFINTGGMNMLGELAVWEVGTGKVLYSDNSRVRDAHFAPDSKSFFYVSEAKTLYKYSVEGKKIFSTEITSDIDKVTVGSGYIYAREFNGFVRINAETGKIENKIKYKFPYNISNCIFSEDGMYALVIAQDFNKKTELSLSVVELSW